MWPVFAVSAVAPHPAKAAKPTTSPLQTCFIYTKALYSEQALSSAAMLRKAKYLTRKSRSLATNVHDFVITCADTFLVLCHLWHACTAVV